MAAITFQYDSNELAAIGDIDKALQRSLSAAGGDAIRAVRADSKRRVRKRKRIRAEYLADRALPLAYPRKGAPIDAMVWTMRASGKEVPLGKYPARQVKRGVSVQVNKGQRRLIEGAFLAKMASGHVGVFKREGRWRLPIKHGLSSRTSDTMQDKGTPEAVLLRGHTVMGRTFRRLMPLELAKLKR